MKTIFALFRSYRDARSAVERLLAGGFDGKKVNAVTQELTARSNMDVNFRTVNVEKSEKFGKGAAQGLDRLLAGQKPIPARDAGPLYAVGGLGEMLRGTVPAKSKAVDGLKGALVDFDVPTEVAADYTNGVIAGGVLISVRASDEDQSEAIRILSEARGEEITTYPRSGYARDGRAV